MSKSHHRVKKVKNAIRVEQPAYQHAHRALRQRCKEQLTTGYHPKSEISMDLPLTHMAGRAFIG